MQVSDLISTAEEMAQITAQNADLMASHEKSMGELEELSIQLANANAVSSQTQRTAEESISALQSQLSKSTGTATALELQVKELTAAKASMSTSIGVFEVERKKSITLLTKNIDVLTAAKTVADEDIDNLTALRRKAEDGMVECSKRLAQMEAALKKSNDDTAKLQRSYDELVASSGATAATNQLERDGLKSRIQLNADEIAASRQHIANLEDQLTKAIEERSQTVASLEGALKNAAEALAHLESESNTALSAAKLAANAEIEALQAECTSSIEFINAMKSHIVDLEIKHKKDDDDIRTLAAAKMAADARIDDFESIAEKAKDAIVAFHERVAELEAQGLRSDDQIDALTKQLDDAVSAKAAADARIAVLEVQCEKDALQIGTMETDAMSLLAAMNKAKDALTMAQAEIQHLKEVITSKEGELASSHEASAALQMKAKDALTMAQAEVQHLKEVIVAKESELAGSHESSASLNKAKEAELVAVNDRLSEASISRLKAEQEVEALKVQGQKNREERKSLDKRVSELEDTLKQTSEERTILNQQLMDATAMGDAAKLAATKEADDLKTQCKKVQDELSTLQQREQELEASLVAERGRLLALTKSNSHLTTSSAEEVAALKYLLTELETKASDDNNEIAAWTQKYNEISLINEADGQRIVQLEGQVSAGSKDYASLKSDFDAVNVAMAAADGRIAQLTEQGKTDASALEALQTQIGAWKTAIAVNEKCKADLEATLLASGGEISTLKTKEQVSADEISALKQVVDSCQIELETLNATVASIEVQKLKGEESIASLTQQLADCNQKLLTETDAASQRIGVLEGQGKAYEADISVLKKQLDDQKAAAASVNAEYQSFRESSTAAISGLEAKGKTDDATIASLRAQAKLDSENIASSTDRLMSLTNEFQAFKSDAEQTIVALQSKAKNDSTEIANLRAQNATDSETIASMTQQLTDTKRREKMLSQEIKLGKESAAATIGDLKMKVKRDDDEIEALKRQLAAVQTSFSKTVADLQALLKKSNDELAALDKMHVQHLTTSKAAADQEIEIARKQVAEDSRAHDAELARVQQALADAETNVKSIRVEHLSSDAKHAENCLHHEAAVEALRIRIVELEGMLDAASLKEAVATAAATVSLPTSTSRLPPQDHPPASSHPHAHYDDGFQLFDSDAIIVTDLSAFNTDPGQDPETVLHMLIKIKMEYALVCSELDRARNEISRVKRISLINAQPIEPLRRKATGTSETKKTTSGMNSMDATATHKSGGSSSFSSDMLKSTADLLRIKAKSQRRNGSGSVTGSMAGSMVSFSASLFGGLGGGSRTNTSVRGSQDGDHGDLDNWEISSQTSAVSTAKASKASLPPVPRFISTPK